MSSAGWLKIAAEGIQDTYIHGKPDVSYFTTLYKSHSPFLLNTFEVPFNNPPLASGGNAVCRVPYKGDLLRGLSLKVNLPSVYTPGPGWIKTLRYAPTLMFNFNDGTNVIVNAQQTTSNIFKTYNEISNVNMFLSNTVGTISNAMYIYGTPYQGLVNVADQSDLQYILANLITTQYVEPVTTPTRIFFANCIANAVTTNITNANLSPVISLYATPVAAMNVYGSDYTGAVNTAAVVSHGSNIFNLYLNLTSQQPRSFTKTIYLSNITSTYSTDPVTSLFFTYGSNAAALTDQMRVYNSGLSGIVTANIYTPSNGRLVFTSQQPLSLSSNLLVFETSANLSTSNITQTQLTIQSSVPSLVANSLFAGMNLYFSSTGFNVATPPNLVSNVTGSILTANIVSQQPRSEYGTLFVSNIVADITTANITSALFGFVAGPYGSLTYGNVYGLSVTANVAQNFPGGVLLNVPSTQPLTISATNVMFYTTTSNISTIAISTSNIAFFSPTGPPLNGDTVVFSSGGFTGTTTVTSNTGYPSDVAVSITTQQPKSFANLSVTYNGKSATVSTISVSRQTMYVSNLTGPDPSSIMYTNILGTTSLGGYLLPYFGAVQNVISYNAPNLVISFPPQQPVSFQNNFTRYAFSSAQIATANITQAVYKYVGLSGNVAASVGQYVSAGNLPSLDYVTAVNTAALTLTVSFPSVQPFVKSNVTSYISPYSNIFYQTTPISNCQLQISNTYGNVNLQFQVTPTLGTFVPSAVTATTMNVSFATQQPFSFTNVVTIMQSSSARVSTNAISNTSVTFGTSAFTNDSSVLNTSNNIIGTITNKSVSTGTLNFAAPVQPYSATAIPVYIGYAAIATTNLLSFANVTISNKIGPGTIQVGSNVYGLGYTSLANVATVISATSLQLQLTPPQQPLSLINLAYFTAATATFTSPSSIPWLNFPKATAQQVAVYYNQVTQKWNFKSYSKPISNLAFTSYENMVFWGFDPHNRS